MSTLLLSPVETRIVTVLFAAAWVPAAGSVLATSPSLPPSTLVAPHREAGLLQLASARRPRPGRRRPARRPWSAACRRRRPRRCPRRTFSPAAGVDEMILPTWLASEVVCSVWVPEDEPALGEQRSGLGDGPAGQRRHGGLVRARCRPAASTVLRSATWVPAAGSVPTTRPFSSTVDVTGCTVADRRFAACSAARARLRLLPDHVRHRHLRRRAATRRRSGSRSARASPTTTAAAMPIAIRRPRRRSGSSS